MLRAIAPLAPLVAALMVVVLLFEPPALRPAERIPTLRALMARPTAGLNRDEVQNAIRAGYAAQPATYRLRRVTSTASAGSTELAGTVYTPFLRIAWASHAAAQSGQRLTATDIPDWLSTPVIYVALRSPVDTLARSFERPAVTILPAGEPTCCDEPQPTLVRPIWVADDATPIARFGAEVPFEDLGLVVGLPARALHAGIDIVAFYRLAGPDGRRSIEMRGRITADDLLAWK